MKKINDIFKCNPLACLTVFLTITTILFGSIKSDVMQIRQEISGVYAILAGNASKTALAAPTKADLAKCALLSSALKAKNE
ncbi:MAG: hypothetical protein V1933_07975 [Candidatus Omnitrophota bacterium]